MTGVVTDALLLAVFASFPPETLAWLVTAGTAGAVTATVSVKGAVPAMATAVVRVAVTTCPVLAKVQPVPLPDT